MSTDGAADLADVGREIGALAVEIAERLADLRRELEPARELWAGDRVALCPTTEWTIAADGLLGRDGVVGLLSGAMKITWPGYSGAGWADAGSVQVGPGTAPVTD